MAASACGARLCASLSNTLLALVLMLPAPAAIAAESSGRWNVTLEVPGELRPLLEENLDLFRLGDRPGLDDEFVEHLAARSNDELRDLLATAGYFTPQIRIGTRREDGILRVIIGVEPGPQAVVAAADIRIGGAVESGAADAGHAKSLAGRWRLQPGTPFRQSSWDAAKDALLRVLLLDGYPAARISDSRAEVDADTAQVRLTVSIDSGPLFLYGETRIEGLQRYPRMLLDNLRRYHPGQRYNHEDLLRYQSALQSSGFFRSVSVAIDPDPAQAAAATVRVIVIENPAMKIDLGGGFSTDAGPRGELTFTRYNSFQPGWQNTTRLRADRKEQIFSSDITLLPEPGDWRNRLGVEASRSDIEDLVTRRFGLIAQRSWRSPEREHDWSLKFQNEEQSLRAGPVDNLNALTLNYSWTQRRVDDLLRPRRGYLLNLQLGGATAALLSTRSFTRAYGRGLYIVPLTRRDRIHLRGEAGAVWSDAREGIPTEFLFRAGGDQSVRGYDYQSLGVRQGSAVVGGRYLGVATIEYQRELTRDWGAAIFADSGNAADSPSNLKPVQGYGVGVRWMTPAGALNLDLARGRETGQLRIHFTLGARF